MCVKQSERDYECSFVSVQVCNSANACLCVYVSVSVAPFLRLILFQWLKERNYFFFFFYLYVILEFKLRYYNGHISLPISFHTCLFYFVKNILIFKTTFIWAPWYTGLPEHHCPCVSTPYPLGRGSYWCFLKKDNYFDEWNENGKKTGTWQHAPCCSFNLVWWIYCYFISTRKYLLLGKVDFCVVLTVNIHIWKVKMEKI